VVHQVVHQKTKDLEEKQAVVDVGALGALAVETDCQLRSLMSISYAVVVLGL
jgi:hypothetical protein